MKHPVLNTPLMLEALLQPETALERLLIHHEAFSRGLMWGEPRFGHPEGRVALHVREVLDNINRIPGLHTTGRHQLRLVALAHDTFKYAEHRGRPRDWSQHHGQLARRFMENYTDDRTVLDIIESHDDAYYAWLATRNLMPHGRFVLLDELAARLAHCWQNYYLFFKCDTQTGDKTQAPLKWFERTAAGIDVVPIRER
jgi:hypothetical protein